MSKPNLKTQREPISEHSKFTKGKGYGASFYMALLAIVISLVGTCVSIIEARILREQQTIMNEEKEASVWPYVSSAGRIDVNEEGTTYELSLINEGVGPALIGNIEHNVGYVSGSFLEIFTVLKRNHPNLTIIAQSSSNQEKKVLGAGDSLLVFRLLIVKGTDATAKPFSVIGDIATTFCYCSIYGDCWSDKGIRFEEGESCGGREYLQ
jgi:hypothetical protein